MKPRAMMSARSKPSSARKAGISISFLVSLRSDLDAYLQALDFFGSAHEAEPALAVWDCLLKLGRFVPFVRTFPLVTRTTKTA